MEAKDEIGELLIGSWAIIFLRTAGQLTFFRDTNGFLKGKFIRSKQSIEGETSKEEL